MKFNEKNSILFNEMVRLGKEYESTQERANQTNLMLDERIAQIEARLIGTEQQYLNVDRKGDTNQGILAEIVDKMESKVL